MRSILTKKGKNIIFCWYSINNDDKINLPKRKLSQNKKAVNSRRINSFYLKEAPFYSSTILGFLVGIPSFSLAFITTPFMYNTLVGVAAFEVILTALLNLPILPFEL